MSRAAPAVARRSYDRRLACTSAASAAATLRCSLRAARTSSSALPSSLGTTGPEALGRQSSSSGSGRGGSEAAGGDLARSTGRTAVCSGRGNVWGVSMRTGESAAAFDRCAHRRCILSASWSPSRVQARRLPAMRSDPFEPCQVRPEPVCVRVRTIDRPISHVEADSGAMPSELKVWRAKGNRGRRVVQRVA